MLKIFTDLLDPFLWGLFPIIRKFERKYKNFDYEFVMGGLIGNYEEFPLDKYFISVEEMDKDLAKDYMRKSLEEAIIFEKNIFKLEVQKEILDGFGLDYDEFLFNYENSHDLFLQDRMEAFDYRVKKLPGFLITKNHRVLQNIMDFSRVEEFFLENLDLEEREEGISEEEKILDYIRSYDLVLKDEIKIVFEDENILEDLIKDGKVKLEKINSFEIVKII